LLNSRDLGASPLPTGHSMLSAPAPNNADLSYSESDQWHDAADVSPDGDMEATAPANRPPSSPIDPATQDRSLKQVLEEANELKTHGNDVFRDGKWQRALEVYLEGLQVLPPQRPQLKNSKGKAKAEDDVESGAVSEYASRVDPSVSSTSLEAKERGAETSVGTLPIGLMEQQCAVLRSILNSNIAACYVKLDDHKSAVKSCTDSLLDVPTYAKALQRRASSNEALGTWSSLSAAEQDYKTLLNTLPSNSPLRPSIRKSLDDLPPRIQRAQKAETDEMLDKLKGLGNSVLGRFGLSTDNFKFTPNEQGGYSMNFVR